MITIPLPSLGEGVEKGTVVAILVKEGEVVSKEQSLIEVETDKVTMEVPSDSEGTVQAILVAIGDEVAEGEPIMELQNSNHSVQNSNHFPESKDEPIPNNELPSSENKVEEKGQIPRPKSQSEIETRLTSKKKFRASPLARKVAREIGVNISDVSSSDDSNRISVKDVKNFAKRKLSSQEIHVPSFRSALPDFSKHGSIQHETMTGIAKATSKNMVQSWTQIPHAWLQEKVDITELEVMRKELKHEIKASGGALTITIILAKAISKALEKYPLFNSSIDVDKQEIIIKEYINIGVAVDTDNGLVVPVIKAVNQKSLTTLSIELTALSSKARAGKLKTEDMSGATFTISNLGGIGSTGIFPLVNYPQVGILGVAGSTIESKWTIDRFEPRFMMPITIGFDHRVINGADAARFLKYIKRTLETCFMASL